MPCSEEDLCFDLSSDSTEDEREEENDGKKGEIVEDKGSLLCSLSCENNSRATCSCNSRNETVSLVCLSVGLELSEATVIAFSCCRCCCCCCCCLSLACEVFLTSCSVICGL